MKVKRAVILIAVQNADRLPGLAAAWDGAKKMEKWAMEQGIEDDDRVLITDESEPVDIKQIKNAVRTFVERKVYDQLIIYFSGHGVNSARNEYWLLSDLKNDLDEAVNVTASEDLASYCGIPHVVFFSDACRTAAKGITEQSIQGGVIFPPPTNYSAANTVDLFYATRLGQPSLEIPDVDEAAETYEAVYTETLLEALNGEQPAIVESDATAGADVVRPWPLNDFLAQEVPLRVFKKTRRDQVPDSRITSRPESWVSVVLHPAPPTFGGPPASVAPRMRSPLVDLSTRAVLAATTGAPMSLELVLQEAAASADEQQEIFKRLSDATSVIFGPTHFETGCGFKVDGGRIDAVFARNARHIDVSDDRTLVRLELEENRATNVLLVFDTGKCAVLPGIHEFVTALSFVDEELANVSYDPMDYSHRWEAFQPRREEIQHLRSVVAASSAMGAFRLSDDKEDRRIATKMQLANGLDPSLALYAAYACRNQGRQHRLRSMANNQQDDIGITLFDIAMLARRIDGMTLGTQGNVLPFGPLLSQGWALLPAHDLRLPASLSSVARGVITDSLWTLYDKDCVNILRDSIEQGMV